MDEYRYKFEDDPLFMKWLIAHDEGWDSEYSGNLEAFYSAYLAGVEAGRASNNPRDSVSEEPE